MKNRNLLLVVIRRASLVFGLSLLLTPPSHAAKEIRSKLVEKAPEVDSHFASVLEDLSSNDANRISRAMPYVVRFANPFEVAKAAPILLKKVDEYENHLSNIGTKHPQVLLPLLDAQIKLKRNPYIEVLIVGNIGIQLPSEALPILLRSIAHPIRKMRGAATVGLRTMLWLSHNEDLDHPLTDEQRSQMRSALVQRLLSDSDHRIRLEAAKAFVDPDFASAARDELQKTLADPRQNVRVQLIVTSTLCRLLATDAASASHIFDRSKVFIKDPSKDLRERQEALLELLNMGSDCQMKEAVLSEVIPLLKTNAPPYDSPDVIRKLDKYSPLIQTYRTELEPLIQAERDQRKLQTWKYIFE